MPKTSTDGRVSIPLGEGDGWQIVEEIAEKTPRATLLKARRSAPNEFFFMLAKRYEVEALQAMPADQLADIVYRASYDKIFDQVLVAGSRWVEVAGVRWFETAYEMTHSKMGHIVKLERVAALGPVVFILSGEGHAEDMLRWYPTVERWCAEARFGELTGAVLKTAPSPVTDLESMLLRGGHLYDAGRYREARDLSDAALTKAKKDLGAEHKLTFVALANLGEAQRALGDAATAIKILEDAVSLGKKAVDANDPHLTKALVNLGRAHLDLDHVDEAEALFRDALARAKTLGPSTPYVAIALNSLGYVQIVRGDFAAAEATLREALAIFPDAPGTAPDAEKWRITHNLGRAIGQAGRLQQAEPLLIRALEGRRAMFGMEHPDTAESTASLATLYFVGRDGDRAEPLATLALALARKVHGDDSLLVSERLVDLSLVYNLQKKARLALPLFDEALRIREKRLGKDHPRTEWVAQNLAGLRRALG